YNLLSGITLHEHYELIMESGIGGVHINSRTPDFWLRDFEEKCRLPKSGTGIRISKSFHSLNELAASCLPLDYATLSPIYDSISKTGYKSHFQNKSELSGAIGQSSFPIVALGGVTPDKFNELRALGFGGAAMLGALF
ncbi:MAG: thiamine phosphate synthase, partial [Muribaculaceae bacterium]|nr:thiamine phosphate synthase [Muribaculaceae bacterium]